MVRPVQRIAPMLEDLAQTHADQLQVAKLNVDENPATAQRFDVMSIPTLILFRDGQPADRIVGAVSKDKLLQEIAETIR
jgi:thioredoxin 1